MGVSVGGDKQPAIGSVLTDTPHPVPDSEWLAVLLNALQVANSLDVVGQHGTNGDGRFLNFLFNQVRCRRVLQIGAQLVDFNGQQVYRLVSRSCDPCLHASGTRLRQR